MDDLSALDGLLHEVGTYRCGEDFKELLEFMARFPKIAPFNAMLLHTQKPGSKYVASAQEWKSKFNREIKPGARPLVILWPFAPVHYVFELGDTEGLNPFPDTLLNPFKTSGSLPQKNYDKLVSNLPCMGIAYHEADYGTTLAGRIERLPRKRTQTVRNKQVSAHYQLLVNQNHSNAEKLATITHELGHLFCGHLGTPNTKWWPDRSILFLHAREFEAETVSWLVCERFGVKNPSAEYLSGYLDDEGNIPPISLDLVIKSAGVIERIMKESIQIRKDIIIT